MEWTGLATFALAFVW